jgi:hypothetical protein
MSKKKGRPTKAMEAARIKDQQLHRLLKDNDEYIFDLEEAEEFFRFVTDKPLLLEYLHKRGFVVQYHTLPNNVGTDVKVFKPTSLIQ